MVWSRICLFIVREWVFLFLLCYRFRVDLLGIKMLVDFYFYVLDKYLNIVLWKLGEFIFYFNGFFICYWWFVNW